MSEGIEMMNEFLRRMADGDTPRADLFDLKAAAFEACAKDSRANGDVPLAIAAEAAAIDARAVAESLRVEMQR